MKKKILSIIMVLIMVLSIVPISTGVAFAEYNLVGNPSLSMLDGTTTAKMDIKTLIYIIDNWDDLFIDSAKHYVQVEGNETATESDDVYFYTQKKEANKLELHYSYDPEESSYGWCYVKKDTENENRYVFFDYWQDIFSITVEPGNMVYTEKTANSNQKLELNGDISIDIANGGEATNVFLAKDDTDFVINGTTTINMGINTAIWAEEGNDVYSSVGYDLNIKSDLLDSKLVINTNQIAFFSMGIGCKNLNVSNVGIEISTVNFCVSALNDITIDGVKAYISGKVSDKTGISFDSEMDDSELRKILDSAEFVSGILAGPEDNCIEAKRVSTSNEEDSVIYGTFTYKNEHLDKNYLQSEFVSKSMGNSSLAPIENYDEKANARPTDFIMASTAGTVVTLHGNGIEYPETWEPYYETLALKIQAQAEVEAFKMLEEANLEKEEEPVVEEKVKLIANSKQTVAPNEKNSVKVSWTNDFGYDGYDVYRAVNNSEDFRFIFNTKNEWYYNTLVRRGQKYSYMVKGYIIVNSEKIYSEFSNVTSCEVK